MTAPLAPDWAGPLARLGPGLHRLSWQFGGRSVEARLKVQRGARHLVVHFHGAINRALRTPPVFNALMPHLPLAHQLTLADPSLTLPGEHRLAWYAGDAAFPAQAMLPGLFAAVVERFGVRRTVYFGTSGGGFAALFYAHQHPGSVAVVGNPQTNLAAHHGDAVAGWLAQCWPGVATLDELVAHGVATNLLPLYAVGMANTVILVQSLGDLAHWRRHTLPLAGVCAPDRVLLHTPLAPRLGHVATPGAYADWVRAVINAPGREVRHILATFHAAAAPPEVEPAPPPPPPRSDVAALGERLARWYREGVGA